MAASTPAPLLEIRGLSLCLQHRCLLADIDLTLAPAEIFGIVGPNGAGKTTLFRLLTGGVTPTRGRVLLDGVDVTGWPPYRLCRVGLVRTFQIPQPFPEMTAAENVRIALWFGKSRRADQDEEAEIIRELLSVVGLGSKAGRLGRDLTLSEQRRLEVARALATRPRVLLLDEIAAGMSPKAVDEAAELILRLRDRGVSLLVIDHFLTLTARVSHRLLALDRGRVVAVGTPADVLNHPDVLAAYLGGGQADDYEELSL